MAVMPAPPLMCDVHRHFGGCQRGDSALASERRVLIWSQRELSTAPARCVGYEFEDVVATLEHGADVVAPAHSVVHSLWSPLASRLAARFSRDTGLCLPMWPGLRKASVEGDYDLFFAVFQFVSDVSSLRAIPNWRTRARRSVCVIEEIWAHDIKKWRALSHLLQGFDHVFLECSGSVDLFEEISGIPCSFLPPGVDALRFCPAPASARRVIDVCHVGRRVAATHVPLLEACKRGELYYEFDSIRPEHVWDTVEHREHLANMLKRSRYVLVNPGKFNQRNETRKQQELGFRFFEGAAAGAVMLGSSPKIAAFEKNFDWKDAVIEVDAESLLDAIERLDSDPDRLEGIRRDNVANSLLRHDWVYRWERVLEAAGLPSPDTVATRKRELANLASTVTARASAGL
jgi:hypothetical protein